MSHLRVMREPMKVRLLLIVLPDGAPFPKAPTALASFATDTTEDRIAMMTQQLALSAADKFPPPNPRTGDQEP